MKLLSPVFRQSEKIPQVYSCDGKSVNPPLIIYEVPKEAKSMVLIVDDPDAPMGNFVHWVVFDISPTKTNISEDEKEKFGTAGVNSSGRLDYVAPCPPLGTHRYFFKLYALDINLNLPEGTDKMTIENAMRNHVLEKAELIGIYSRN